MLCRLRGAVRISVRTRACCRHFSVNLKGRDDSANGTTPTHPAFSLTPSETMAKLAQTAESRGDRPVTKILASSALAAAQLSFGGMLFVSVAGGSAALASAVPGIHSLVSAMVFPTGLSLIVLTGTDLLTGNMLYASLPFVSEKGSAEAQSRAPSLLATSFVGNVAASSLMAVAASALLFPPGSAQAAFAAAVASKKCALPVSVAFFKAIGANWLVNLAIFQAATSQTTGGKILGVWMPVTAFVALGLEHSVANMFLLPLGFLSGAEIGLADAAANLIPVTAGNMIGAGLFVGAAHSYALQQK